MWIRKQPNPDENPDLAMDFKSLKKKIRQPKVLRLLSNAVISKKKARTLSKKSIG
jgi:hypothetical protein